MTPSLRIYLLTVGLFISGTLAAAPTNVVFVISDDQGYGDLGCTGNPIIKTPHIDQLASENSGLSDYHVAPTCSPTRCSLLTGHWTNRTGVWHTIMGRSMLRENEVTVGQMFTAAGYETGMFGKWHLGDNYPYRPEDRGFTEVFRHGGVGQTPDLWNNAYFDGSYFHNGKIVPAKGFCTDVFFARANAFISKCAKQQKPFFAYITTNAPHKPLHCPPKYFEMYEGQSEDIAKENPEVVAKMREFYDEWWAELEPTFSQTTEIYLGHPEHPVVSLTAHDWIQKVYPPWHQGSIRAADRKQSGSEKLTHEGHWAVKVVRDGKYQISLRRWPAESGAAINSSLPAEEDVPGATKAFRAVLGNAIGATHGVLQIDEKDLDRKPVEKDAEEVTFVTELKKGSYQLAPFFEIKEGELGAYYVVVTSLD
jgi:hypothetical protein